MMKKFLMLIYAVCAMLVIIGSLLWFVFTLRGDSLEGKAAALNSFKVFAQHTAKAVAEHSEQSDSALLQIRLEQLCHNYRKYIQTVLIRDSAGVLFVWPQDTDIFSYNEQNGVEVKNLPLFFTAAQMHIPIRGSGETVTVHAALQTIPVEVIFNRGQIVFFLLLLIVVLTITALIFSYVDSKAGEREAVVQRHDHSFTQTEQTDAGVLKREADNMPVQDAKQFHCNTEDDSMQNEPVAVAQQTDTYSDQEDMALKRNAGLSRRKDASSEQKNTVSVHGAATAEPTEAASEFSLPLSTRLEALDRLHIYDGDSSKTSATASHSKDLDAETDPTDKQTAETPISEPVREQTPEAEEKEERHTAYRTYGERMDVDTQELNAENYGSFENHIQAVKPVQEPHTAVKPVTTFENTPMFDADHSDSHSLEQATLIEELTTAITETAVAEEDLTLLLIHANDIPHNQQVIHLLRSTLDRIHKVFVFNKDTLGLIVFYAPLDQAMQIASNLYDEIYRLLDTSDKKLLGIGLTTRAGRLIPAHRMIEEASAAIGKAIEEGGDPIVAFRVNPDKYRRCIARLS